MILTLKELTELRNTIEEANQAALSHMYNADPVLVDVAPASEVMPQLGEGMLLHAGPPVQWPAMCSPMQGAVVGRFGTKAGRAPRRRRRLWLPAVLYLSNRLTTSLPSVR